MNEIMTSHQVKQRLLQNLEKKQMLQEEERKSEDSLQQEDDAEDMLEQEDHQWGEEDLGEQDSDELFSGIDKRTNVDANATPGYEDPSDAHAGATTKPFYFEQTQQDEENDVNKDRDFFQSMTEYQKMEVDIRQRKAFTWGFGKNTNGELGNKSVKDQQTPTAVAFRSMPKWISSGSHHSAIVTKDGQLFMSGSTLHGKIGIQGLNLMQITKFHHLPIQSQRITRVACGDYHTLCLTESGQVFAWGGTLYKKVAEKSGGQQNSEPRLVTGLQQRQITFIDCGDFHSLALDSEGKLFTWGGGGASYNKGQCGHGTKEDVEAPKQVNLKKKVVQASAGGFHTLALCDDNELLAWGNGMHGECGFGEFLESSIPRQVKFMRDGYSNGDQQSSDEFFSHSIDQQQMKIAQISAGGHHSLLLTEGGLVYSFGYGSHGQLGLRNTKNYGAPQLVRDLMSKRIAIVSAGWNHSLVLSEKGDLFSCGYGNHGQLGLGDQESKTSFTHISALGPLNIQSIFAGGNHSWVVIDENMPVREHYRPPSPVQAPKPVPHVNVSTMSPYSLSPRNTQIKKKIENSQHDVRISVTYTVAQMCQRFVNFEIPQSGLNSLEEYQGQLYRDTDGGILYHKLVQEQGTYSLCMIVDPKRSNRQHSQLESADQRANILEITSNDMESNMFEKLLGEWALEFGRKVADTHCVRCPRYSELRPSSFRTYFV